MAGRGPEDYDARSHETSVSAGELSEGVTGGLSPRIGSGRTHRRGPTERQFETREERGASGRIAATCGNR